MALPSETKLGPYEILSPLGAGGMGEVYRARDTRLDRDVAIKVLPESFARDADRLRRFEQEARTVAALNHPNILGVYDIGQYQGSPYMVCELLDGETLRDKMQEGPMPHPTGAGEQRVIDLGELTAAPSANENDVTFSRDGRWAAFSSVDTNHELRDYLLDMRDGKFRPVTPPGSKAGKLSPDGTRIVTLDVAAQKYRGHRRNGRRSRTVGGAGAGGPSGDSGRDCGSNWVFGDRSFQFCLRRKTGGRWWADSDLKRWWGADFFVPEGRTTRKMRPASFGEGPEHPSQH